MIVGLVATLFSLANDGLTNLKKVTFGDIDYVPYGLFANDSIIEEIEFDGLVGHFDGWIAQNCPRLRKIVFHGPVSSTGGPDIASDCPQLQSVVFQGPIAFFNLNDTCPTLAEGTLDDLERIANWQTKTLREQDTKAFFRSIAYHSAQNLLPELENRGSSKAASLKEAMEYAWNTTDDLKTTLNILKESPAYQADTIAHPRFEYAHPSDSLLTLTRLHFNLDSVAGNGDDISRIKNLLYWVHDNIPHNGSNGMAPGPRNLRNTYDCARRDSCGYNCRALAICLTEALLAEGIPARYITCQSKAWDTDGDCHVICVAWSQSLGKWIWVDPTFAAYVTDENGLLLHPGEVRYRLQHDLPLILNEDANWNHQVTQTVDYYLKEYMAKNLYILSTNLLNQAEPEGATSHPVGAYATLVPIGSNFIYTEVITTDPAYFWQSPEPLKEQ